MWPIAWRTDDSISRRPSETMRIGFSSEKLEEDEAMEKEEMERRRRMRKEIEDAIVGLLL